MFSTTAVLAAMLKAGVAITLDNWLEFNMAANDPPSAEMLEIVPQMFHEEYCDRIRLWNEYETKFEERNR
jgi:hypothetical protein